MTTKAKDFHKFPYRWTLADANFTKDKGKVFSCFACGGGSTMGYKLAGFDVIGDNEIDPRMNKVYVANHHPKHNYLMDIRELVKLAKAHELPEELYNLDVLDGSPPCSSFSTAGNREKDWGKEKNFREGQASQVLDTLFFDFIELANELRPKVVIAENVSGLIKGEAKKYVNKIYDAFEKAGYFTTLTLCKGVEMGLPQMRERVFFVCVREDLTDYVPKAGLFSEPYINLEFNEQPIPLDSDIIDYKGKEIPPSIMELWEYRQPGDRSLMDASEKVHNKKSFFGEVLAYPGKVCPTLVATGKLIHYNKPLYLSKNECIKVSSFPGDYDFVDEKPAYICGMSVPPVMIAQVASRVWEQWLSKINK